MFEKFHLVGILIFSVAMVVSWAVGQYDVANSIYMLGCALLLLGSLKKLSALEGYGKIDVDEVPSFLSWNSIADGKTRLGLTFVIIGELGAWPVRAVLGSMIGAAIGAVLAGRVAAMRGDETVGVVFYYAPRTTVIFLAYSIQLTLYLYIFPSEYYTTNIAKIALITQVIFYAIFVLHFLSKDGLLRSFQDGAIHPYIVFGATLCLAVFTSAIVHIIFAAVLTGSVPRLTESGFFSALKSLTVDQRVLDLGAIAKQAHDFRSLFWELYGFLLATTALQVLDFILGTMVVFNLARSVLTIIWNPRDDQSFVVRSMMLASVGRFSQAAKAARLIKDKNKRADVRMLLAIAEGNTEAFESIASNLDSSSQFAMFGASQLSIRYGAISVAFHSLPLQFASFLRIIDCYWTTYRSSALCAAMTLSYFALHKTEVLSGKAHKPEGIANLLDAYFAMDRRLQETPPTSASYRAFVTETLEDLNARFGPHQELFALSSVASCITSIDLKKDAGGGMRPLLAELGSKAHEALQTDAARRDEYMIAYPVLIAIRMRIETAGQSIPEIDALIGTVDALLEDANIEIPDEAVKMLQGLVR